MLHSNQTKYSELALEMRCLLKALFVLKAVYFVACDFLDLQGPRTAGVVKKS